MIDLVSTYRIQFNKDFTFTHLEPILPYLHQLGVKTIYASPIFKAVPGSTHGYDVTDPLQINPELGTIDQLRAISKELSTLGMNWLQDIVPNHMAYHPDNKWLMDVLENGTVSKFYDYFDITAAGEKISAPFLGDKLETVVAKKELQLRYGEDGFFLKYFDNRFPLNIESYNTLLHCCGIEITSSLKEIMERKDIAAVKEGLFDLQQNDDLRTYIRKELALINADPQRLMDIVHLQHYRPCHWQETDNHINYRRFFTINEMISLNMQHEEVFAHYHRLIKQLVDEGVVNGLRVDHIDGLYDPFTYLNRLRALVGGEVYISVEKILEPGESLPQDWPVQGTTGYDFLAMANNLFTDRNSKHAFVKFYKEKIAPGERVRDEVFKKKAYILNRHMAGDLDNLYKLFVQLHLVAEDELAAVPVGNMKTAIGELLVHCPVYRFYGNSFPLHKEEADAVATILKSIAKQSGLHEACAILHKVLLGDPANGDESYNARVAQFYMRCMQFSGPLMAKGVEDTLMYTYNRFIAHNEVGDAPSSFGIVVDEFHKLVQRRRSMWPLTMNTTATHDTKRGEDARMRLNVLSNTPAIWFGKIKEWQQLNAGLKQGGIPDANEEYFIYETLVASYPMPDQAHDDFTTRFKAYIQKAFREAKTHTDWVAPDSEYEKAIGQFVDALLSTHEPFLTDLTAYLASIADNGILNSLCQQVLKYTCPGIPDLYQGGELWDLSMVDPDNRRPVNYEQRIQWLSTSDQECFSMLWDNRYSGQIKLWLVNKLLKLCATERDLLTGGRYIPLKVKGTYRENVIAYARVAGSSVIVVALPLHTAAICALQNCSISNIDWQDTTVVMPDGVAADCTNIITGTIIKIQKKVNVNHLFDMSHFAVLRYDTVDNPRGAGILLPIFSVPSPYGIGDFGKGAKEFADFLHRSGQKYWQILPLNPTEGVNFHSPYSSISSIAGNPLLISPDLLAEGGLFDKKELKDYYLPDKHFIDYKKAEKNKYAILDIAWQRFKVGEHPRLEHSYEKFCEEQKAWLNDFALYKVLKDHHAGLPWYEWPSEYKWRDEHTLDAFIAGNVDAIDKVKWLQFLTASQWSKTRHYCNELGIKLVGDMPFYVSYDSVDIWANPQLFNLDGEGKALGVAGVPPDYFSEDGQLWGMPTFKWDKMREDNYAWWMLRLRKNLELFDLVRLDHFRAFETYWEVPAGDTTARNGKWLPGPRMHFFEVAERELGGLPLIAEDLGYEMEDVYRLRDATGLPGMKVLQFAWGDNLPVSVDIPHNYTSNCVVYTGTHDNNTTKGWYKHETKKADHRRMREYIGVDVDEENVHIVMSRLAYASVANIAILPIQDVLGLDEKFRMNTPGTTKDNWMWRLPDNVLTHDVETRLMDWVMLFKRK